MPSTHSFIFFTLAALSILVSISQSASVRYLIPDALQQHPSAPAELLQLWLDRLRQDGDESQPADDDTEHLWKRFAEFLPPIRERRRFGNTRYGRSVPADSFT